MYKIVGCASCRQLQVTAKGKTFECKYCGRSCELAQVIVHYQSADPDVVLAEVERLRVRDGMNVQK